MKRSYTKHNFKTKKEHDAYWNKWKRNYARKHVKEMVSYNRKWRKANPDKVHATDQRFKHKNRLCALQLVSGLENPICGNCGCNDIRALEINHINGGGTKEREKTKIGSGSPFFQAIVSHKRGIKDLNVRCRVCNALEHLEKQYSMGSKYSIIWVPQNRS